MGALETDCFAHKDLRCNHFRETAAKECETHHQVSNGPNRQEHGRTAVASN
jgi:hypothetical protein